jgi:hypothetical protein
MKQNPFYMKKIILIFIAFSLLSCGSSKVVSEYEKSLKGNWTLNNINSTVIGDLDFNIFGSNSRDCMIDSNWEFIPNNNTGSYILSGAECDTEKNYFVFNIEEVDSTSGFYDFLLKPTNSKGKSESNKGFRLELKSISDTSMVWEQTINFEGKPQKLTFKFNKQ